MSKVVCFYFYHPGGAPGEGKIYTRYIDWKKKTLTNLVGINCNSFDISNRCFFFLRLRLVDFFGKDGICWEKPV